MALYSITAEKLVAVPTTSFVAETILERKHLQKMLKADTAPLGEELLVLCEEYGNWEDSNRRIDLLCLDKQGCLVVVEIKRTEDGGHMELQAIRYAAMVSSMTLDHAVAAYAKTLPGEGADLAAQKAIADFLEADSIQDVELTSEVRMILVAANFSSEVTTSVIWLNQRGLDIRCVRLRPYKMGDQVLVDATQIIPLPEAADYEVKLREQVQEAKKVRTKRQEALRKFWTQFIEKSTLNTELFKNRSATTDHWLSAGIGRSGFSLNVSLTENRTRVECYIRLGKDNEETNKAAFKALWEQKSQIEAVFGDELSWEDLPQRSGCRISKDFDHGGWKNPEEDWPSMIDWAVTNSIKLEKALKGPIQSLKLLT